MKKKTKITEFEKKIHKFGEFLKIFVNVEHLQTIFIEIKQMNSTNQLEVKVPR